LDNEVGQAPEESSSNQDTKAAHAERHKRRSSNKPWLPVVFSSSFVPSRQDSASPTTPSLSKDNVCLLAIWSRTKSCDCKWTLLIGYVCQCVSRL
jgi:hypothetical protein